MGKKQEVDQLLNNAWATKWSNLSVINIKNFPVVHKKLSRYFLEKVKHDLKIDLDFEHRGISVNTQDPKILNRLKRRLRNISGVTITCVETIPNSEAA